MAAVLNKFLSIITFRWLTGAIFDKELRVASRRKRYYTLRVIYIAALILKVNRPLVRSIFTGQARLDYVQNRHPLWYAELAREYSMPPAQEAEPAAAEKMEEEGSPAEEGAGFLTGEKEKEDEKQAPSKEANNKESST